MTFDIRKFLTENKITAASQGLKEDLGGTEFKVGDTVSDPQELGPGPEFDGKILGVFPNLAAAEGQPGYDSMVDFIKRFPQNAEAYDINGKWYQIEWRSEGTGLYPEKDMERVVIAPDGRDFDDYGEAEYDASIHNPR